jgi:hypothetical protein
MELISLPIGDNNVPSSSSEVAIGQNQMCFGTLQHPEV